MASRTDPASATEGGVFVPVKSEQMYLLLADDDPAESARLRDELVADHCACDVVSSAAAAVRAFQARDYDLILFSLHTTSEPVLRALRELRELERHIPESRVPLFILSRGILLDERDSLIAAGADDVIRRSDDHSALRQILDRTVKLDRRTPPELIPREMIHYPTVLKVCDHDEALARREIAKFAGLLAATIGDLQTALQSNDPGFARKVAEQLRAAAIDLKSGRAQRTAYLATKLDRIPPLLFSERVRELLVDLEHEARDLITWVELGLGRVVVGRLDSAPPEGGNPMGGH